MRKRSTGDTRRSLLWAYISKQPLEDHMAWDIPDMPISENIKSSFLWYRLGSVYERIGKRDVAIEVYDSAIAGYRKAIENGWNGLLWRYYRSTGILRVV